MTETKSPDCPPSGNRKPPRGSAREYTDVLVGFGLGVVFTGLAMLFGYPAGWSLRFGVAAAATVGIGYLVLDAACRRRR